jgi:hypothetical protein
MAPRSSLALLLPIALAATACQQDLANRPCPCDDGWSCSPVSNRCVQGIATLLIDDMLNPPAADGEGGINGFWYTYSDRTVPNSSPVKFRLDPSGGVSPMEGATFDTTLDDQAPVVDGVSVPYRRADGGGETVWGVGLGLDFVGLSPPNGELIPVDECPDAETVWQPMPGSTIPQPFDATDWTGIQFYARSFGESSVEVEIHVDDDRTTPWGQVPLDAGGCNACNSSGADASACSDSFSNDNVKHSPNGHPIEFPLQWALIHVPFSWLHSGNWANILAPSTPIHKNKIYNLHFQVSNLPDASVPPFSIGVAYVSFYKS